MLWGVVRRGHCQTNVGLKWCQPETLRLRRMQGLSFKGFFQISFQKCSPLTHQGFILTRSETYIKTVEKCVHHLHYFLKSFDLKIGLPCFDCVKGGHHPLPTWGGFTRGWKPHLLWRKYDFEGVYMQTGPDVVALAYAGQFFGLTRGKFHCSTQRHRRQGLLKRKL